MINPDQYSPALKALQRLIIHAKSQAYTAGDSTVADLLNDLELLPEFLADQSDRTCDFAEMLQGIGHTHPDCEYIVRDFEQASSLER